MGKLSNRIFFTVLIAGVFITSCLKVETRGQLARRLVEMDSPSVVQEDGEENLLDDLDYDRDARIAEIKRDLSLVRSKVEDTISNVRKEQTYWRLLGLKYMDNKMWGKALEAFDKALEIDSNNAVLFYNRSLCASQLAMTAVVPETRKSYIQQAENGYRQSLAIDSHYTPAMYALAVILIFEENQTDAAIGLLEDFLKIERSDMPARFLLGRTYLSSGDIVRALDAYDYIVKNASNPADKNKARENYNRILEGRYGS